MDQAELFPEIFPDNFPENSAEGLFEVSVDAYYTVLYARMSELPIQREISRYIEKVHKAAGSIDSKTAEARIAADKAASDRGDPDVLTVLKASYKVMHEIHRLTGLLRFTPNNKGMYIARCSPDHCILIALADHFFLRFGETPWAIIDEKRKLCLCCEKGGEPKLVSLSAFLSFTAGEECPNDAWEELWRLYHRSVNNEAKKNLRLQRQFMPVRYQKDLPESGA